MKPSSDVPDKSRSVSQSNTKGVSLRVSQLTDMPTLFPSKLVRLYHSHFFSFKKLDFILISYFRIYYEHNFIPANIILRKILIAA